MFAPSIFSREKTSDTHHFVSKQPTSELEVEQSRAALSACPVAAIRVEKPTSVKDNKFSINPKFNGLPLPFPRKVSPNLPDVYFVGHHNSKSFGAAPYLLPVTSSSSITTPKWILVDTPRYSEPAVRAVESVTGVEGPAYLVLTHVDDTADHNRWKERYPNLKRIFHSGDLGVHNWIGDETLEDVEILLESQSSDRHLQYFDLNGTPVGEDCSDNVVLVHTPGHSPGSISVLKRPTRTANSIKSSKQKKKFSPGVLFSGDTYAYTTREGGHMSGFPRFGNDQELQSKILPLLLDLDWQVLAPGHGHVRDYTLLEDQTSSTDARITEMEDAIEELSHYF